MASQGNNVRCIDLNKLIINKVNSGEPHFYEKGLKSLLKNQLETKKFKSFSSLNELDIEVEMIIIAVGTPSDILGAVKRGIDMFDCVLPTRSGRTGLAFTWKGRINIRNSKFKL